MKSTETGCINNPDTSETLSSITLEDSRGRRGILLIQIAFVALISFFAAYHGIFPSPELLLMLLVAVVVWHKQQRAILRDFLPFVLLLLAYQAVRGIADDLAPGNINVKNLIDLERALFRGTIPAAFLQDRLSNQPFTPVLNVVTNLAYMSHFVVPLLFGLALWQRKRGLYWWFVFGLIALSYAGFLTYLFFPAAPPWWASQHGYLAETTVALTNFVLPTMASLTGVNPVAAMPSLHMAYPVFVALFGTFVWRRSGIWLWLLPITVGFATLYLGHHYVVDLLAGILYALFAFLVVLIILSRRTKPSTA